VVYGDVPHDRETQPRPGQGAGGVGAVFAGEADELGRPDERPYDDDAVIFVAEGLLREQFEEVCTAHRFAAPS
jgi:hypothetical protein